MTFDALVKQLSEQSYPPVDKWTPNLTGPMDLTITVRGEWIHEGTRIARAGLVKLLSTVLRREGDDYFLVSPGEKYQITVEDAPFVAVEVDVASSNGDQTFIFRTNVDDLVRLDANHTVWTTRNEKTGEPRPYLHVRQGLNALVNRSVYYQLVDFCEARAIDGVDRFGIASDGEFYPID